jgi:hypothetical protein
MEIRFNGMHISPIFLDSNRQALSEQARHSYAAVARVRIYAP